MGVIVLTQWLGGEGRSESLEPSRAGGLVSVVVAALCLACGRVDAAPPSALVAPPASFAAPREHAKQTGLSGAGGTVKHGAGQDGLVLRKADAVERAVEHGALVVLQGGAVARWRKRLEFPRGCRPLLAAEGNVVVACASTAEVASLDATGALRWRSHPVGATTAESLCQRDGECRFALTELAAGAGGSWIGGWFFGALRLGDAALVAKRRDAFLASLDDQGRVVSSLSLSSRGDDSLQSLVVQGDAALAVWSAWGRFAIAGKYLGRSEAPGLFLGRFSEGGLDWYREASGAEPGTARVRLARADDGVALHASFTGSLQLGSRHLMARPERARCPRDGLRRPATGAGIEVVVASLGNDLQTVEWLERAGTASHGEQPLGVARSPRGDVAIVGRFEGELRFDTASPIGHASNGDPCAGSAGRETYLGVLSAAGKVRWLRKLPAAYASDLYFDADGRVVVLGVQVRPGDLGEGLDGSVGNYLFGFDGADGALRQLIGLPQGTAALTRLAGSDDPIVAISAGGALELLRLRLD